VQVPVQVPTDLYQGFILVLFLQSQETETDCRLPSLPPTMLRANAAGDNLRGLRRMAGEGDERITRDDGGRAEATIVHTATATLQIANSRQRFAPRPASIFGNIAHIPSSPPPCPEYRVGKHLWGVHRYMCRYLWNNRAKRTHYVRCTKCKNIFFRTS
jgi:hypothetical protein